MIDGMWVWGMLGLILLAAEMATGTIYILWFGISALCVAIAMWLFPNLPHAMQFLLFAFLSLGSLAIWKFNYKKTDKNYRVGQAQGEEIGRTGIVIEACGPNLRGRIKFTQGLMGAREWVALSELEVAVDATAEVVAVEGNALRIKAI